MRARRSSLSSQSRMSMPAYEEVKTALTRWRTGETGFQSDGTTEFPFFLFFEICSLTWAGSS